MRVVDNPEGIESHLDRYRSPTRSPKSFYGLFLRTIDKQRTSERSGGELPEGSPKLTTLSFQFHPQLLF